MGQYYLIVNIDKRQYLHPREFGDGMKLLEFGSSPEGTMTALAILLADGNNRGGGDLRSDNPIIGSWAGDRIVITGDYADEDKFIEGVPKDKTAKEVSDRLSGVERENLNSFAREKFEDISTKVIEAMCDDDELKEALKNRGVKI